MKMYSEFLSSFPILQKHCTITNLFQYWQQMGIIHSFLNSKIEIDVYFKYLLFNLCSGPLFITLINHVYLEYSGLLKRKVVYSEVKKQGK